MWQRRIEEGEEQINVRVSCGSRLGGGRCRHQLGQYRGAEARLGGLAPLLAQLRLARPELCSGAAGHGSFGVLLLLLLLRR